MVDCILRQKLKPGNLLWKRTISIIQKRFKEENQRQWLVRNWQKGLPETKLYLFWVWNNFIFEFQKWPVRIKWSLRTDETTQIQNFHNNLQRSWTKFICPNVLSNKTTEGCKTHSEQIRLNIYSRKVINIIIGAENQCFEIRSE